mmetsp:Transcript_44371/g.139812  ORF Transcript_44371/g.139812 Transcript_44371/m.139812 type:complete len:279 (-) Transcript_44371:214-1050(-)
MRGGRGRGGQGRRGSGILQRRRRGRQWLSRLGGGVAGQGCAARGRGGAAARLAGGGKGAERGGVAALRRRRRRRVGGGGAAFSRERDCGARGGGGGEEGGCRGAHRHGGGAGGGATCAGARSGRVSGRGVAAAVRRRARWCSAVVRLCRGRAAHSGAAPIPGGVDVRLHPGRGRGGAPRRPPRGDVRRSRRALPAVGHREKVRRAGAAALPRPRRRRRGWRRHLPAPRRLDGSAAAARRPVRRGLHRARRAHRARRRAALRFRARISPHWRRGLKRDG